VPHDFEKGTQKAPDFLALNPLGKVPVLVDRGPDGTWADAVVTESAAIAAYVADVLPDSGLAPMPGTSERAHYARWMGYCPSVLEQAFADEVFPRREPPPARALGWPSAAVAVDVVEQRLAASPFLAGATFSAADLMVGGMLRWLVAWGKLTPGPATAKYLDVLGARPALARSMPSI